MGYEVESNVPMPEGAVSMNFDAKYGWDRLKVGDSIFVPESEAGEGKTLKQLRTRVYNAARGYGAGKGRNFKALVVEEERPNPDYEPHKGELNPGNGEPEKIKVKGVRCWRLDDDDIQG